MNTVKSLAQTLGNGIGLFSSVVLGIFLKPKSIKGLNNLLICDRRGSCCEKCIEKNPVGLCPRCGNSLKLYVFN